MWFDGKGGIKIEIIRLALCLSIGIYAYLEISLAQIAISVLVYSAINILLLPLINRTQVTPEVQQDLVNP
jgi:hypothetical protein